MLRVLKIILGYINVTQIVVDARGGKIKRGERGGGHFFFHGVQETDKVKTRARDSRWRLEKDTRSIHRMHAITSVRFVRHVPGSVFAAKASEQACVFKRDESARLIRSLVQR